MIEEAIEKVSKEIADLKEDYAETIGTYVITDLLESEGNAEKVLAAGKSLKACIEDIKGKAKAKARNGMAMVEDKEVFRWVRSYYGVSGGMTAVASDSPVSKPTTPNPLGIDLADLLG